jgi:Fe-S-cluster-containing dehydrogenase component
MAVQEPERRVGNFDEVALGFTPEDALVECERCLLCPEPACVAGCPAGIKGLVTEGSGMAVERHADIDEVVAIGPPIMMRACAEMTRPLGIKTMVSLNPIMVDGTGMCGGCRVKIGDKMKFACVDGPDFDGHAVDFDDLMNRLRRFKEDEKLAIERWSENCRQKAPAETADGGG